MPDHARLDVVSTIMKISKDPTNYYTGRMMWFSFIFLYFSVVYVVQITWFDLVKDFQCHGNISKACVAECYESHFTSPILGVWYVIGFVFFFNFFMMESFASEGVQDGNEKHKKKSLEQKSSDTNNKEDNKEDNIKTKKDQILYFTQNKFLLATYLVYFLVQLSVQLIFSVILIHNQLPLLKKPIWCSTLLCLGPYACVIRGTQEKFMSIILLVSLSVVIMIFCIMFFLFTIDVYLFMRRSAKNYRSAVKFRKKPS